MTQDKLSAQELAMVVSEMGYWTTTRQLERWREERLLTPSVVGVAAEHSAADIRRCIAIHRSLHEKDDLKYTAKMLWAAGFDLDPAIWRPGVEKLDRLSAPLIRRLIRRFGPGQHPDAPTAGDWMAQQKALPGALGKIRRRLSGEDEAAAFAGVMLEIASGDFAGFEHEEPDEHGFTTKLALLHGLGLSQGEKGAVFGQGMGFADNLQSSLSDLAVAVEGASAAEFSNDELCSARDDVRNALKAVYCIHQAGAWFLGKDAFGLGLAAHLARSLGESYIAMLTPAVARLRRTPGAMISHQVITEIAAQAEAIWLISNYFYEAQRNNSKLRDICGPEAMKLSFKNSVSHRSFIRSLSEHSFPEACFNPWALWKSTSRTKKMPSGLLAMSIGAHEQLSLADVVASANGPTSPSSSAAMA